MKLYNADLSKNAVSCLTGNYTYRELCTDVRRIADYFTINGVRKVAVVAGKGYAAYCVLWAAYTAGITVCSLNNDLPEKRVSECLAVFSPELVIADAPPAGFNSLTPARLFAASASEECTNVGYPPCNSVMYVLFTSGSTGSPKGVAILRTAFEEVIDWALNNLGIATSDIVGQYCNLGFDMGLCDVFLSLSAGACLVPVDGMEKLNPGRVIRDRKISCIYAVPTLADIFIKHCDFEKGNLASLRLIGFGGASLFEKHIRYICKYAPSLTVYNTYGPTETTLFTSCVIFRATEYEDITNGSVCLGNPITGVEYELTTSDDKQRGELVVLGEHCLAGYLNGNESIEFGNAKSKNRFATGDIVEKKDGNYYFICRKDNQIKLRGNRIDLDGVDSKINATGINAVSMVAEERLIIFYEGEADCKVIHNSLVDYLPQNCLPDEFIRIEMIPLNGNGKYDRTKLPQYYNNIKSAKPCEGRRQT